VDLQSDPAFQNTGTQLISIALDSIEEQQSAIAEYNIEDVPMLVDANQDVSKQYDVLQWAVGTGEPGHTFILVNENGQIVWVKDYGSPNLPNPVMWVDPAELVDYIKQHVN
jgi:peroxiredoxin